MLAGPLFDIIKPLLVPLKTIFKARKYMLFSINILSYFKQLRILMDMDKKTHNK